jgi:hypothetical protein
MGDIFRGLPQPLIGFRENVRYRVTPRRAIAVRSVREDMILLLGLPTGLAGAWFLWQEEVAGQTGPLSWFFGLVAIGLALIALGCVLVVFWAPAVMLDKRRGTLAIRTWRIIARPLVTLRREEIECFRIIEDYLEDQPGPNARPIYTYVHVRLKDGSDARLLRLYEPEEAGRFQEYFAIPAGIPVQHETSTASDA